MLSCLGSLFVLEIDPLSVAVIFSYSEGCLFVLFCGFLCCVEAFEFSWVPFVCFCFHCSSDGSRRILL